jgi:hypothetical protein
MQGNERVVWEGSALRRLSECRLTGAGAYAGRGRAGVACGGSGQTAQTAHGPTRPLETLTSRLPAPAMAAALRSPLPAPAWVAGRHDGCAFRYACAQRMGKGRSVCAGRAGACTHSGSLLERAWRALPCPRNPMPCPALPCRAWTWQCAARVPCTIHRSPCTAAPGLPPRAQCGLQRRRSAGLPQPPRRLSPQTPVPAGL